MKNKTSLFSLETHFEEDPDFITAPQMVERFLNCGLTIAEMGETSYSGEYRVVLVGPIEAFQAWYEIEAAEPDFQSFPDFEEWSEGMKPLAA